MARIRWNTSTLPKYIDSMYSNTEDWQYIRKTPELMSVFAGIGESIVRELNWELHAAQRARNQKVEDGYKFAIAINNDRIRMRIWTFTARAMAHEAKHQSILKHMRFVGDTNLKGGGRRKMGADGFKGGRRNKQQATSGSRGPSGAGSRPSGGSGSSTRPRSRPAMDPKREAGLRRKLAGLEALADPTSGGTESERKSAAEKARRIRSELGG